jgi:hypothetical protein
MFTVPAGVHSITITADGASGGSDSSYGYAQGGLVVATVPVTPKESLAVFVGGEGGFDEGGYNGGSPGQIKSYGAHGGGGASDVRQGGDGLQDRVVVAGGGGGLGGFGSFGAPGAGGSGGGHVGDDGLPLDQTGINASGGKGGAQRSGAEGGRAGRRGGSDCKGRHGSKGSLGDGGAGGSPCQSNAVGGGGGGGYYGGGGGGSGSSASNTSGKPGGTGGGGGSSYIEPRATIITNARGAAAPGNGRVIITWHT